MAAVAGTYFTVGQVKSETSLCQAHSRKKNVHLQFAYLLQKFPITRKFLSYSKASHSAHYPSETVSA